MVPGLIRLRRLRNTVPSCLGTAYDKSMAGSRPQPSQLGNQTLCYRLKSSIWYKQVAYIWNASVQFCVKTAPAVLWRIWHSRHGDGYMANVSKETSVQSL